MALGNDRSAAARTNKWTAKPSTKRPFDLYGRVDSALLQHYGQRPEVVRARSWTAKEGKGIMRDIVFVHGGNHGAWCWQSVIDALEQAGYGGRLLPVDVPGCGAKRDRYSTTLTIDEIAIELDAEVRARSIAQALLVGHSVAGILLPRMVALDESL